MLPFPFAPALLLLAPMMALETTGGWPGKIAAEAARLPFLHPAYDRGGRAVTNWRWQAAFRLEPMPLALRAAAGVDPRPVARCVKLNNYWCIKRAGWRGEIGFDEEGHVGFATAAQGADAAVTLLRRYYLELGRRSALDVVRRWAPAECGAATVAIAARGVQGTVRARWLATQRARVGRGKAARSRASAVPLAPLPTFRVPDIAVGMGERPGAAEAPGGSRRAAARGPGRQSEPLSSRERVASAGAPRNAATTGASASTGSSALAGCTDEQRIRNYASRMVRDLGIGPADDLRLFTLDGAPLPNLAPVMIAMSAFELGALAATRDVVEGALARAAPALPSVTSTNGQAPR
jgi:hypothetical protein